MFDRVADGYTFPLNPIWVVRDPGWYVIYQALKGSPPAAQSLEAWYPNDSSIDERIEKLHREYPDGFEAVGSPGHQAVERRPSEIENLDYTERYDLAMQSAFVPCIGAGLTSGIYRLGKKVSKSYRKYRIDLEDEINRQPTLRMWNRMTNRDDVNGSENPSNRSSVGWSLPTSCAPSIASATRSTAHTLLAVSEEDGEEDENERRRRDAKLIS